MDERRSDPLALHVSLAILRVAQYLVPRATRERWMREWEAEVRHRWNRMRRRDEAGWHEQAELVRRSSGAVVDAAFLRRQLVANLDIIHDARYAARMLRKRPAVSLLAICVLALGLGGTITVFSTIDTLLLRELPYQDFERLVTVWQVEPAATDDRSGVAPGRFLDWRERTKAFTSLAAAEPFSFDYLEGPEPVSINAGLVTEGFFETLGVRPLHGRLFRVEEYADGQANVVILGHGAWLRYFGGNEAVVGTTTRLEGQQFLIAGVLPPSFHPDVMQRGPTTGEPAVAYQLWAPQVVQPAERQLRNARFWSVVGRLAPGVTLEQAQAELATISSELAIEYPRATTATAARLVPLREHIAGPLREPLTLLLGAVVMLLLIACANVASLLLARSLERHREFAVRAAIGAARWRLVRQTLVEAALLVTIAGSLGVAGAFIAIRAFVESTSQIVPQLAAAALDTRLLLFATGLAIATSLLVGVWPAMKMSRGLNDGLRETAAGVTSSTHRRRLASGLIVGEVALALVLLTAAGLLIRSFVTLADVDAGFARSTNIAVMQVFAYGDRYQTDAHRIAFFDQTLERFRAQRGVARAGLVSAMPFLPSDIDIRRPFRVEGRAAPPDNELPVTSLTIATSEYFESLRIPLTRGRLFSDSDRAAAPPVVIVNDLLAERSWPGEDAVGKRISTNWQNQWRTMEVVGVVGRVRHNGLESDPRIEMFMPFSQTPFGSMTFVVETSGDDAALLPLLKTQVWESDPTLPIWDASTLDSLVAQTLAPRRFILQIVGGLSALAFALSAIGIYGMLSFSTTQRTREIGLRLAMGASDGSIMKMVLREGMLTAATGATIGLVASLVLSRGMAALLYGISPTDPTTLAATTALLLAVAFAACYLPARRATRIDPLTALRTD
jgi:putative ABC transport system permease protein